LFARALVMAPLADRTGCESHGVGGTGAGLCLASEAPGARRERPLETDAGRNFAAILGSPGPCSRRPGSRVSGRRSDNIRTLGILGCARPNWDWSPSLDRRWTKCASENLAVLGTRDLDQKVVNSILAKTGEGLHQDLNVQLR
jgi:hypothetical protein